jgi:hypothetical protein
MVGTPPRVVESRARAARGWSGRRMIPRTWKGGASRFLLTFDFLSARRRRRVPRHQRREAIPIYRGTTDEGRARDQRKSASSLGLTIAPGLLDRVIEEKPQPASGSGASPFRL